MLRESQWDDILWLSMNPSPSTRMNSTFIGRTVLLFLRPPRLLLFLHLSRSLLIQLRILIFDLLPPSLRIASTSSSRYSVSNLQYSNTDWITKGKELVTYVNSTLIFLAGLLPSSKLLWWNSRNAVFIWSYPSNSMKAQPLDLVGSSFLVKWRIDLGLTAAKCLLIDSVVAVYGRLPMQYSQLTYD